MRLVSIISGLAALVAMAGAAQAGGDQHFPAAACTPVLSTADKVNNYQYVRHATAATGKFVLTCPVHQPDELPAGPEHFLRMAYRDSTGTGTDASVVVRLIAENFGTGTRSIVATITSNAFPETTFAAKQVAFSHSFNMDVNFYFLQVEVTRAATTQIAEIHLVDLE